MRVARANREFSCIMPIGVYESNFPRWSLSFCTSSIVNPSPLTVFPFCKRDHLSPRVCYNPNRDDTTPHAFWVPSHPPRVHIEPGGIFAFQTLEASATRMTLPSSRRACPTAEGWRHVSCTSATRVMHERHCHRIGKHAREINESTSRWHLIWKRSSTLSY